MDVLGWLYNMLSQFFGGLWTIIKNLGLGIFQMFNVVAYYNIFSKHASEFNAFEWIVSIILLVVFLCVIAAIVYLFVLLGKRIVRYSSVVKGNEDLLCEISDLHRDIERLTLERDRVVSLKRKKGSVTDADLSSIIDDVKNEYKDEISDEMGAVGKVQLAGGNTTVKMDQDEGASGAEDSSIKRFYRLSAVDEKYSFYEWPVYENDFTLSQLCDNFRNFACSEMGLFYEIKTIRLMFAGLASTKLILLQGISGTGKTSLPYAMGKFFKNDATIASVQPSWRDRTELFGYFNEFTKKFNETEVLKRIYESSYNDDINVIILDEMNIARVEYYFAEMLSILEMPDPNEWKVSLVPSRWPGDPQKLEDGQLTIPQNIWYIGTANNDDSTFSISDKFYDRAFTINLDNKGIPFTPEKVEARSVSYSYVEELYQQAIEKYAIQDDVLDLISQLDNYIIAHFRVAFGNRILKQLGLFVPVYVACGGEVLDGVDYILATKVIRKFEALNMALIRDEIDPLINYMDKLFGKNTMKECIRYLKRIKKMY